MRTNFVVSTIFKFEVAVIFLFYLGKDPINGFYLAAACACVNQITEMLYVKKETQLQRLFVLLGSLFLIMCLFIITYAFSLDFTYVRHGEARIDTPKIWLLVKSIGFTATVLGAVRLLALGGDWFVNRHEQNKKLKNNHQEND
ncbi:MAG: hypothetical protein WCK57_13370 [Verrucomicrobiae bacterium]